jgi:hypothetical protein
MLSFKQIRIIILLLLLAFAAIYTQEQELSTKYWYKPITVAIFPINGDGQASTADYISKLTADDFKDIDTFFNKQAKQYKLTSQTPIVTQLGPLIDFQPPHPPADRSNTFSTILWSLQLRYWAYQHTPDQTANTNRIRLYVLYHQPQKGQALAHSLGLPKGLIGIIHAYATPQQTKQNQIVMTHEIFHTVGASDKYDQQNPPVFPMGYAKPDQKPLYPQRFAEIMAGRKALSATSAELPPSLRHVIVGPTTAKEINWIKVQP